MRKNFKKYFCIYLLFENRKKEGSINEDRPWKHQWWKVIRTISLRQKHVCGSGTEAAAQWETHLCEQQEVKQTAWWFPGSREKHRDLREDNYYHQCVVSWKLSELIDYAISNYREEENRKQRGQKKQRGCEPSETSKIVGVLVELLLFCPVMWFKIKISLLLTCQNPGDGKLCLDHKSPGSPEKKKKKQELIWKKIHFWNYKALEASLVLHSLELAKKVYLIGLWWVWLLAQCDTWLFYWLMRFNFEMCVSKGLKIWHYLHSLRFC